MTIEELETKHLDLNIEPFSRCKITSKSCCEKKKLRLNNSISSLWLLGLPYVTSVECTTLNIPWKWALDLRSFKCPYIETSKPSNLSKLHNPI
jgi:hypothetical protein